MNKTKFVLVEDHEIVREGIKSLLNAQEQFEVINDYGRPDIFLNELDTLVFEFLILDLSLPKIGGLEVLKILRNSRPEIHVIILTMHNNPEYMIKSIQLGASAFLTKDSVMSELVTAINKINENGFYYPEKIDLGEIRNDSLLEDNGPKVLSPKEIEVVRMLAKGLSSKLIANELGISSRTVEAHRLNILRKLGASNSAEAVTIALKNNFL